MRNGFRHHFGDRPLHQVIIRGHHLTGGERKGPKKIELSGHQVAQRQSQLALLICIVKIVGYNCFGYNCLSNVAGPTWRLEKQTANRFPIAKSLCTAATILLLISKPVCLRSAAGPFSRLRVQYIKS